jgi:hypothetical protein
VRDVKQGGQQKPDPDDAAAAAGVAEPAENYRGNEKSRVIDGQDERDQEYVIGVLAGNQGNEEYGQDPGRVVEEV